MPLTLRQDFVFENQIATDHIGAYFRKFLVVGNLAYKPPNEALFNRTPGEKILFPYWGKLSPAQDGVENTAMDVDNLADDQFETTVKEIVKAVGITDTARIRLGTTTEAWEAEVHRQIGRVFSEKVDEDIWTELNLATSKIELTNNIQDFTIATAFGNDKGASDSKFTAQTCNIRSISQDLTDSYGDRRKECMAVLMHSGNYNSIETDVQAGFLKADANDPLYNMPEFVGRAPQFFNIPFFVVDNVPKGAKVTVTDSASATQKYQSYKNVYFKKDAFGFFSKQEATVEYARDTLKRADTISSTQWYAIKSFHEKISSDDKRLSMRSYLTREQTT